MDIIFSHEKTGQYDCLLKRDMGIANGKTATGFSEEAGHTILVGTRSADNDEFEPDLSAALNAAFTVIQINRWTNVAIDINSFAQDLGLIPYVNNVIIDWLFDWRNSGPSNRLSVSLLQGSWIPKEELLLKVEDALLRPVKENANQYYGDADDPLTKKIDKLLEEGQEKSFPYCLLRLIDEKGFQKDSEVYRPSGISKSTFSKIKDFSKLHKPAKATVAALTIGMKLNLQEAQALYQAAGYYLGETDKLDIIIRCFIQERRYDLFEVNCCLYELGLPLLGEHARDDDIQIS